MQSNQTVSGSRKAGVVGSSTDSARPVGAGSIWAAVAPSSSSAVGSSLLRLALRFFGLGLFVLRGVAFTRGAGGLRRIGWT